ncbi:hypothetical protein HZB60_11250 [candidate division KSB1 bacterium]|nr:hypothetical protein [candidate division KSB1 bacterium]
MSTPIGPRLNAMKHGLRATDEMFLIYLRDYERDTFEDFRATLHENYHPHTDEEKLLVDRIAIQYFRLFRLYGLEYQATNASAAKLLTRESVIPHLDRFSRYDSRMERQLRSLLSQLRSLYVRRGDLSLISMIDNE